MSCHSTSGGIVSTSLARAVTGLTEKDIQHLFHALKREAGGMAAPSELDVREWRSRQYDLLTRMKRMSDTRRDKMRDRLFRSRSESVPDGATFHAWRTIEARARQEAALREIDTAVDLAPPGSQAHLYDIGPDGRPTKVWYASYGSNLHRDRFMNYIEGGSPEGSTRVYDGCTDKTPPENDIPIRFAGARPHFALTSRVWRGGIAFIDAQKGESAQGLGRAYEINVTQFDEVVAQENGLSAKWATPVPLKEVLTEGRAVIGTGSYETILHIGDYEGAPVLTFTAPFTTREALTKTGHILRTPIGSKTPIRMPVMTNKPSPAYLRMIGGGLQETFGMDEIQQADYLRGCPGGDRWTRQQMVRILRGEEPDPPREPGPENPKTTKTGKSGTVTTVNPKNGAITTGTNTGTNTGKPGGNGWPTTGQPTGTPATSVTAAFSHARPGDDEAADAWARDTTARLNDRLDTPTGGNNRPSKTKTKNTRNGKGKNKGKRNVPTQNRPATVQTRRPDGGTRTLPGVKTYPTVEDQQVGITRWTKTLDKHTGERDSIQKVVTSLETGLRTARTDAAENDSPLNVAVVASTERNLDAARTRLTEANRLVAQATDRLNRAKSQTPARYYSRQHRTLTQWREEDSRLLDQQRATEAAFAQRKRDLRQLRADPNTSEAELAKTMRHVDRLETQCRDYESRLQETYEIIQDLTRNT